MRGGPIYPFKEVSETLDDSGFHFVDQIYDPFPCPGTERSHCYTNRNLKAPPCCEHGILPQKKAYHTK